MFRIRVKSNSQNKHNHGARLGAIDMPGNRLCLLPLDDVVRGVESGINPAAPWIFACAIQSRQLEIERLPIGVQDHVKEQSFLADFHRKRNAMRMFAPVRLIKFDAVPSQVHATEELVQAYALAFGFGVS